MRHLRWPVVPALTLIVLTLFAGATSAQDEEQRVQGTIEQPGAEGEDDQPVAGVTITVATAAGEEVGTATTADDGTWSLDLPEPGDYTATIDEDALPEGVGLRNPDQGTLEFSIQAGQQRTLLFPLGEGRAGRSFVERIPQLLVEGVKFGLIIAITAIGLSLIFGTTGLTNFAHGELVTFGALAAYFFNVGAPGLQLIPAAGLAVAAGGLLGAGLDLGLFRPLRKRGTGLIALLVVSIGLSIVIRYIFLLGFGGRTRPYADYAIQRGLAFGPISIAPKDLTVVLLSVLTLIGVALILQRTRIGKAMRAVADNRDLAESSGIDVDRVILYVWVFGAALAALGGVFLGLGEQVSFQMGFLLLLLMFAAVTLGGLGSPYGALVGGLVVGIAIQLSTLFIPTELRYVPGLGILILVLLFRPQGILGTAERIG